MASDSNRFDNLKALSQPGSLFYKLTIPDVEKRSRVFRRIIANPLQKRTQSGQWSFANVRICDRSTLERLGSDSFLSYLFNLNTSTDCSYYDRILATVQVNGQEHVLIGVKSDKIIVKFDFWDWEFYWQNEAYVNQPRPIFTKLPITYSLIPMPVRNFIMRNILTRFQMVKAKLMNQVIFPSWPKEVSLDVLRWLIWTNAAKLENIELVSTPYPNNSKFVVLLTHDVDTEKALNYIKDVREVELKYNFVSSWSFLSKKYNADDQILKDLIDERCEIISHGYLHDGKLPYLPTEKISQRLEYLFISKPWLREHVQGFRSEQILMSYQLFALLANYFKYDLSMPDTEKFGPYGITSGCCTIYPFYTASGVLEFPLTLPQDFYMLHIYRFPANKIINLWIKKSEYIEKFLGCAVIVIHPEHLKMSKILRTSYDRFLQHINERNAFVTTPKYLFDFFSKIK